jgi:hypothetical protein
MSEAVFSDVHKALSALYGQVLELLRSVSEAVQTTRPVLDVDVRSQCMSHMQFVH